jgi:hypothetical protein
MRFDENPEPGPIVNNCNITVPDVVDLFRTYHAANSSWGSLHIVLEDLNLKNNSVLYCINAAQEKGDREGEDLAWILLSMSKTQRKKIARKA